MLKSKHFDKYYNEFSKHLVHISNKFHIDADEYLKVVLSYIEVNTTLLDELEDNSSSPVEEIEDIDDNVNFD